MKATEVPPQSRHHTRLSRDPRVQAVRPRRVLGKALAGGRVRRGLPQVRIDLLVGHLDRGVRSAEVGDDRRRQQRAVRGTGTGQPAHLDPDRGVHVQHVAGHRDLEEGRTLRVRGQVAQHRADRGDRGLVTGQQQTGCRTGIELDAAEVDTVPRTHQHDAVTPGDACVRAPRRGGPPRSPTRSRPPPRRLAGGPSRPGTPA